MISDSFGATFEIVDFLEVIATNTQGILLEENGSRIYAFKGGEHDLVPGDYVTVSGTIAERNGLKQLDKVDLIIAKTSHNDAFKQPDATTVSVKDIEASRPHGSTRSYHLQLIRQRGGCSGQGQVPDF